MRQLNFSKRCHNETVFEDILLQSAVLGVLRAVDFIINCSMVWKKKEIDEFFFVCGQLIRSITDLERSQE